MKSSLTCVVSTALSMLDVEPFVCRADSYILSAQPSTRRNVLMLLMFSCCNCVLLSRATFLVGRVDRLYKWICTGLFGCPG